jgi:hypothetical protein
MPDVTTENHKQCNVWSFSWQSCIAIVACVSNDRGDVKFYDIWHGIFD